MKVIIDIDEQHFELLQMAVMNGMGDNAQKIIAQGIPLEQIRYEIQAEMDDIASGCIEKYSREEGYYRGLRLALRIIDKYK